MLLRGLPGQLRLRVSATSLCREQALLSLPTGHVLSAGRRSGAARPMRVHVATPRPVLRGGLLAGWQAAGLQGLHTAPCKWQEAEVLRHSHEGAATESVGAMGRKELDMLACASKLHPHRAMAVVNHLLSDHSRELTLDAAKAMLSIAASTGGGEQAISVLDRLRATGAVPDTTCLAMVLSACAGQKLWEVSIQTAVGLKSLVDFDQRVYSHLLKAARHLRRPLDAYQLLQEMRAEGVPASLRQYNNVLVALTMANHWREAVALYRAMLEDPHLAIDSCTFNTAMMAYNRGRRWRDTLDVGQTMKQRCTAPTRMSTYHMVHACQRVRRPELVPAILDDWLAVGGLLDNGLCKMAISTLCTCRMWKEALHIYDTMVKTSVLPDRETFQLVLLACRKSWSWWHVEGVLHTMQQTPTPPNTVDYNIAIAMCLDRQRFHAYCNANSIHSAQPLEPTWQTAGRLLAQMRKCGVEQDDVTLATVQSLCRCSDHPEQTMDMLAAVADFGDMVSASAVGEGSGAAVDSCLQETVPLQVGVPTVCATPGTQTHAEHRAASPTVACARSQLEEAEGHSEESRGDTERSASRVQGAAEQPPARRARWDGAAVYMRHMLYNIEMGRRDSALTVFLSALEKGVMSTKLLTVAMTLCLDDRKWLQALELYHELSGRGLQADLPLFHTACRAALIGQSWDALLCVLNDIKAAGMQPTREMYTMAMKIAAQGSRPERVDAVEMIFRAMLEAQIQPDTKAATVLVDVYHREMRYGDVVELCAMLQKLGVLLNSAMYRKLLYALSKTESDKFPSPASLVEEARGLGLTVEYRMYMSCLNACAVRGKPQDAVGIVHGMRENGIVITTAMYEQVVDTCVTANDCETAMDVLNEMLNHGLRPSREMMRAVERLRKMAGFKVMGGSPMRVWREVLSKTEALSLGAVDTEQQTGKYGCGSRPWPRPRGRHTARQKDRGEGIAQTHTHAHRDSGTDTDAHAHAQGAE